MIIKKFSPLNKLQHSILQLLGWVKGIILAISLVLIICHSIFTAESSESKLILIITISIGILSGMDLIYPFITKKDSWLDKFILKLAKKSFLKPTNFQKEILSWLDKHSNDSNVMLIVGKEYLGKTTAVLSYVIESSQTTTLSEGLTQITHITYIDCKSDKLEIINEIDQLFNSDMDKHNLIIIDQVELMGDTFIDTLFDKISSYGGISVLISEKELTYTPGIVKTRSYDIDSDLVELNKKNRFEDLYSYISILEREIFLIIYVLSITYTFIPKEDIYLLSPNIKKDIKKGIKTLIRKGLILEYPLLTDYILIANSWNNIIQSVIFKEDYHQEKILQVIMDASTDMPESAWYSLIFLPLNQIQKISKKEKNKLFSNALSKNNYSSMYKQLKISINSIPRKENEFLYELGTLNFINGYHKDAYECFSLLLNSTTGLPDKYPLYLKIIEATHGDSSIETLSRISQYLSILSKAIHPYDLYGSYWDLHINAERGKFNIDGFTLLIENLMIVNPKKSGENYHKDIIRRCYTDLIRSCHILNIQVPHTICDDFARFMRNNYSNDLAEYYIKLYVDAGSIHYYHLLDNVLNDNDPSIYLNEGLAEYNNVMKLGSENPKSLIAAQLKRIDLRLFDIHHLTQKELDGYKVEIKNFIYNAEIENVSVHVAFAQTLLAKLLIFEMFKIEEFYSDIDKVRMDKINSLLNKAKDTYKTYNNGYGVLRTDMIKVLFNLILPKGNLNIHLEQLKRLSNHGCATSREQLIYENFVKFYDANMLTGEFRKAILRAYPLIMQ